MSDYLRSCRDMRIWLLTGLVMIVYEVILILTNHKWLNPGNHTALILARIISIIVIIVLVIMLMKLTKKKKVLKAAIPANDVRIKKYFDDCVEGKSVPYGDILEMAISPAVFYGLEYEKFQFEVAHDDDSELKIRVDGFIELIRPLVFH